MVIPIREGVDKVSLRPAVMGRVGKDVATGLEIVKEYACLQVIQGGSVMPRVFVSPPPLGDWQRQGKEPSGRWVWQ